MLAALWWWRRDEASTLPARVRGLLPAGVAVASGFVTVVATMLAIFAIAGAFDDLYHATISYNVFYSGETYASRFAMLGYLLRFPIERARVDGLWFVGGLGCAVILVTALVRRTRAGTPDLLPVLWVAAACLSIAVNGSRGLPQYFLQAAPALALAFGVAAAWAWPRLRPIARGLAVRRRRRRRPARRQRRQDRRLPAVGRERVDRHRARARTTWRASAAATAATSTRRSPCASWRS